MSRYYRGVRQAERALLQRARRENVPVLILWEGPNPKGEGWAGQISSAPARISMLYARSQDEFYAALDRLREGRLEGGEGEVSELGVEAGAA